MTLSEVIESIDILEYISQFVELEEKNGEHWGLSPLKDEETPSFSVDAKLGKFYDFSSGRGGNVMEFVKLYNKCSSAQAADILRQHIGADGKGAKKLNRMAASKIAKKFSRKKRQLKTSKAVILSDDYMKRYSKNMSKLRIWEDEGISKESMDRFQVYYDDFSDRIVYPIRNPDGKIINISGRTIDPNWKEKKLRKYTYFKSFGTLDTIYGFYENLDYFRIAKEVIIFEGAKSVMVADSFGLKNTCAILTSHINPYQFNMIIKLGYKVVLALDKGVNIKEDDNIRRLKRYVNVEYILDTDDLLEDKMSPIDMGKEVWANLYSKRRKYI